MSATRRRPVDVFEDGDTYNHTTNSDHDIEKALLNALGPLSDASSKANCQLNPSTTAQPGSSPFKKDSSPLRPMSAHALSHFKISPPRRPNFQTDSPQKDGSFYSMYQQVAPRPDRPLYPQHQPAYEQENAFEGASFGDLSIPFSDTDYGFKAPNKRTQMDAPAMKRPAKKQKFEQSEPFDLPHPQEMPSVVDDGQKPTQSYAELIGMAILRAPNRRLTLAQIYKWISDNYSFYRSNEGGWQNSIRHNLSLNKNFIKQERPKDDPGKGNYWAIKPGEERPFLLGKKQPVRKITSADGPQYMNGLPMAPSSDPVGFRSQSTPAISNFTLGPTTLRKTENKDIDSAKFPDDTELSSEGTIPASDPALQDDEKDDYADADTAAMPPPPVLMRSSPPPQDLGSSPPTMEAPQRSGTPPPAARLPSSSRSRGERRKFAGLNDSGYWSSIESSAACGAAHQLASENDVRSHRIKKGRAEAEIARIRSSSFDSPSMHQHGLPTVFGSSPTRRDDNPLTPAVVFKRPARPPPSISPNTNLRDHRNAVRALLGSPAKGYSPMPNTWSPAFTLNEETPVGLTPFLSPNKQGKTPWRPLDDTTSNYNLHRSAFDIFIDAPEEDIAARGSPEKRENRRPSLARAATSTGILADITGAAKSNNSNIMLSANDSPFSLSPFVAKTGSLRSPARLGSPLKRSHQPPTSNPTASELSWFDVGLGPENAQPQRSGEQDDVAALFGVELHSDGSEEGIDIFQDFGKIGQASQAMMPTADRSTGSPVKKTSMGPPARPGHGRSNTSRW